MTIVFATDGSENAKFAETFLTRYPASKGSQVYCCSVYSQTKPFSAAAHPFLGDLLAGLLAQAIAEAKASAEESARTAAENLAAAGFDAQAVVLEGDAPAEITGFADVKKADLTVLGARGTSGIEDLFVGSVARATVNLAKRSILIVRKKPFAEEHGLRAVFATDFSENSARVEDALQTLIEGRFASLEIVSAPDELQLVAAAKAQQEQATETGSMSHGGPESAPAENAHSRPQVSAEQIVDGVEQWFTKLGSRSVERLKDKADNVTYKLLKGDARTAILAHVQEVQADLLIVGARSISPITRLLLGSVSHYMVSRAPCSVMVVRPHA